MNRVYLGLGSNLNQPVNQLAQALHLLENHHQIQVRQVSSFYRTTPVGFLDQPDFINAVAELATVLDPLLLLVELQAIEKKQGRIRDGRLNQPRVLDLDILLYGNMFLDAANLVLPHPRLRSRAFVLAPLAEIAPELELPSGEKISELIAALSAENLLAVNKL